AEEFPACFTDDVSGACSGMDTAWAAARQAAANRAEGNDRANVACENHYPASASVQVRYFNTTCGSGTAYVSVTRTYPRGWTCPSGSNWDEAKKECTTECPVGEWPDPLNPGQCLNDSKCRERNDTH